MTPQQRAAAAKRRLQTQQLEQARRLMQGKGLQPAVVASMLQAQALHQQGPGAGARVTKGAAKGLDPTTTFNRCWDFDKGKCSRGSSCWYLHVEDGGKGGKSKDEAGKTRPALGEGKSPARLSPVILRVIHNGVAQELKWISKEQALTCLTEWGVLDTSSAGMLRQVSEEDAREIVSSLGPEVRNPSAFVTKALKLRNLAAFPDRLDRAKAGTMSQDIAMDRYAAELRAAAAAGELQPLDGEMDCEIDDSQVAAATAARRAAQAEADTAAAEAAQAEAEAARVSAEAAVAEAAAAQALAEAAAAEAAARAARRGARSSSSKLYVFGQAAKADAVPVGEMEPSAKRPRLEPSADP